jgi:hypothetical protein
MTRKSLKLSTLALTAATILSLACCNPAHATEVRATPGAVFGGSGAHPQPASPGGGGFSKNQAQTSTSRAYVLARD